MNQPTTELDSRFSEPGGTATPWHETERALESAELLVITTVRADGRPHVTPLVAVWLERALHFCTGADEQKAVNLRSNRHVVLTTGNGRWQEGLDVVVEGDAVRVTDDPTLRRLAAAWHTKWDGRWQYAVRDGLFHHAAGAALVFAVAPAKVLVFGKRPFTQTRHRL